MKAVDELAREVLGAALGHCTGDCGDADWLPPGFAGLPPVLRLEVMSRATEITEEFC